MIAWAAVLAGVARHGWTARDVNQLIRDWIGVGHWLPDVPHKPIGLLRAILAWHGDLAERPAALEEAREAAERAAHQARIAAQLAGRAEAQRARAVGRAALGGAGHAAARAIAAEVARRAAHNRGAAGRRGPDAGARCRVARGDGHPGGVAAGVSRRRAGWW